jgi:hypothetical protein
MDAHAPKLSSKAKRSRGRPREGARRKTDRFFRSPNKVAAALAEQFVRTYRKVLPGGELGPISHVEATQMAVKLIEVYGRSLEHPLGRPDFGQAHERLRKCRTDVEIEPRALFLELLRGPDRALALELLLRKLERSGDHQITIEIDPRELRDLIGDDWQLVAELIGEDLNCPMRLRLTT